MSISKTATISVVLLVLVLGLSTLLYFFPVDSWIYRLPILNTLYTNTSITVNTRNGKAEIFLNDKSYGQTPTTVNDILPGEYILKLVRVSEAEGVYKPYTIPIEIQSGTEAVIDMEIAPLGTTHGYVLYYTQSPDKAPTKGFVSISTINSDASIFLDNQYLNESPVNAQILEAKEYKMKISKEGYETLDFPIIIREGFNLNIKASLMPIPINIQIDKNEQN